MIFFPPSVTLCSISAAAIGPAEACLLLLADPEWQQIQHYLPHSHCIVIREGTESVGLVAIASVGTGVMELMNVAVRPDRQGLGYGRCLVEAAMAYGVAQGASRIDVSTGETSRSALALYHACGFSVRSIDKDYFVRHYSQPIYEENRQCRSRITLSWVARGYQQGLRAGRLVTARGGALCSGESALSLIYPFSSLN